MVLAADKRATAGYYVAHRRTKKIVRVWDKIAITTAGLVADAQALADYLESSLKYYTLTAKHPVTVRLAAHYLSQILYSYKLFPLLVQLIVAGYDTEPRLFGLDWYGGIIEDKYIATGSGTPIAMGIIESEYSEDLSTEEARRLAVKAIKAALRRDAATGDGVDTLIIEKERVEEKTELLS